MMIISAYVIRIITAGSWATNWTKKGEVGLPGAWNPNGAPWPLLECWALEVGGFNLHLQNRGSTFTGSRYIDIYIYIHLYIHVVSYNQNLIFWVFFEAQRVFPKVPWSDHQISIMKWFLLILNIWREQRYLLHQSTWVNTGWFIE